MAMMVLLKSGDMATRKMKGRTLCQCRQCEESWFARKGKKPVRCPFCFTRAWDRAPKDAGRPGKCHAATHGKLKIAVAITAISGSLTTAANQTLKKRKREPRGGAKEAREDASERRI